MKADYLRSKNDTGIIHFESFMHVHVSELNKHILGLYETDLTCS